MRISQSRRAGRRQRLDGIVDPDDGCRYPCHHRCGVGRARGSRTHASECCVGWVERSDTHQLRRMIMMGFARALPILRTNEIITVTNVRQDRSHHAFRRPAPPQFDREGDGRGDASHFLLADPQFQPRFFAGDLRHRCAPDRAGRSFAGSCRRIAVGDDRGRRAVQGRQAGRCHPAQRSLSWRQPSA